MGHLSKTLNGKCISHYHLGQEITRANNIQTKDLEKKLGRKGFENPQHSPEISGGYQYAQDWTYKKRPETSLNLPLEPSDSEQAGIEC